MCFRTVSPRPFKRRLARLAVVIGLGVSLGAGELYVPPPPPGQWRSAETPVRRGLNQNTSQLGLGQFKPSGRRIIALPPPYTAGRQFPQTGPFFAANPAAGCSVPVEKATAPMSRGPGPGKRSRLPRRARDRRKLCRPPRQVPGCRWFSPWLAGRLLTVKRASQGCHVPQGESEKPTTILNLSINSLTLKFPEIISQNV